jgi:pyruvate,water dikinase
MRMIRSDAASSGVIFSIDTETGHPDMVLITAAYGLGENVVQGAVDPDEFYVHKPTYEAGHRAVLRRHIGAKQQKMVLSSGRAREPIRNIPTSEAERGRFCLSDPEVLELAGAAIRIEQHYSGHHGKPTPMDIEWAKDGPDGALYIVQARPETVASARAPDKLTTFRVTGEAPVLATGRAVGELIAAGPARVAHDLRDLAAFQDGDVLVAETTTPDWEPVMKRAAAIVTNRGGRTCHAAIVARELGVPAVVGAGDATGAVTPGTQVTVSCAEGEVGKIYDGTVPFETETLDLGGLGRPRTKMMMNLGNPDLAFGLSRLPNDGVGLARMEFIILESIRAHPMALLYPERVTDPGQRTQIEALIKEAGGGAEHFVRTLSEGVGTIAAAFYPRPVILRLSDFKSNEYAQLLGGRGFEPDEPNPMIGLRGAARYVHPAYAEAFALECRAVRRVRRDMGLTNLKLMVPFCRRVEEGRAVLDAMAGHGLVRGEDGLEVYVMCEIPNNVLQADAFSELFDGFSIGSNDLTQLTLGVDRDSELVAHDFDERDPGVLRFLAMAIEAAQRNGRHVGICGQAPSDYPEIARFLVERGIESLSLTPDRLLATTQEILELEQAAGQGADASGADREMA